MKNCIHFIKESTFIERDQVILDATMFKFRGFVNQLLDLILTTFDNYFIWFADYHALMPVLWANFRHKKSFIIVGGHDAYNLPELKYGLWYGKGIKKRLRRAMAKIALRKCTKIFTVADHLRNNLINFGIDGKKIVTIFQSVDPEFWSPISEPPVKRDIDYLTVGFANSSQSYLRKGFDRFYEMAVNNPDKKFVAVGCEKEIYCPNLEIMPPCGQLQLREYYNHTKYYCQLSRAEGAPNTLVEAMFMGCIPIVSADVPFMTLVTSWPFVYKFEGKKQIDRAALIRYFAPEKRKKDIEFQINN
jgi:glycosyltransferase involved in cell wall biosynthesis